MSAEIPDPAGSVPCHRGKKHVRALVCHLIQLSFALVLTLILQQTAKILWLS